MSNTDILKNALVTQGKNVSKYASLKGLNNFTSNKQQLFAKKSNFFGQLMDDGFIFNPYVHRRFLPFQFKYAINMLLLYDRKCDFLRLNEKDIYLKLLSIQTYYNTVRFVKNILLNLEKETKTLILLKNKDISAYNERSKFITPKIVVNTYKTIFSYELSNDFYLNRFKDLYDRLDALDEENLDYEDIGTIFAENPFGFSITLLGDVSNIDIIKLIEHGCNLDSYLQAYFKAGLYYSIKHSLMFELNDIEIKEIYGKSKFEAIEDIREEIMTEKFDFKSNLSKYVKSNFEYSILREN